MSYPPIRFGPTAPATCTPAQGPGELNLFWDNDDFVLKYCSATDTWSNFSAGVDQAGNYTWTGQHSFAGGEILGGSPFRFEGTTDDNTYTTVVITDPTLARTFTIPNANSVAVQPQACTSTDKVSAVSALGVVTCTADETGVGGGDAITVATVAATDPDFIDSSRIDVTLATVPVPDTITWDIVANSINATYLDETTAYAFSSATNTFLGASFTGPTADPADSGILRASNAEKAVCWEASVAGTDVCLEADASEIIQVTGGTFDAADLSGTVPDASVDGANEAGEIDIDNLAGLTAIGSALTITNTTNTFIGTVYQGPTADSADAGIIRLGNAEQICWEASPAGTDQCIWVDTSEILNVPAIQSGAATDAGTVILGGASSTTPSLLTIFGGDGAANIEPPQIRFIPSPVGSGDDTYLHAGGVGGCLGLSSASQAADTTNCIVDMTTARTLTSKTIAGLGSGTTHGTANFISLNRHATDCTAITDGVDGEQCWEKDADTIYVCEPTAGGCDTAGEWIRVTAVGSGGAWDTLTAPTGAVSMVSSADAETVTFDFQSAFAADRFIIKSSTGLPTAGDLVSIEAHDTDVIPLRVTGSGGQSIAIDPTAGDLIFTSGDTNGGFQFIPNGTGDYTFGVAQAFTATFNTGATDPVIDFSDGNIKYSGATTYTFEGGATDPVWTPGNSIMNLSTGTLQEGGVAVSLPARSETLTEKTLNVESSNNIITTVSKIWIDAAACVAGTAATNWDMPDGAGDAQPTAACNDTGTIQRPTLSFSGSAVNGVERNFKLPSDWTGNIDLDIHYLSTAASPAGNVEWEIQTICRAVGETWDAAFNAAQTITDAQAAQNVINSGVQAALTTTTCAAGEDFSIRIWRDGTNDTSNDVALMLGAELTIRRAQ